MTTGRFTSLIGASTATENRDYSSLSGSELIGSPDFLRDLTTYYTSRGQSFSTTEEMLDEWYTDQRWKDSNFVSAGRDMLEYESASDGDQALMTRLSMAWQNAPSRGSLFEQVVDYGSATIFDPINFIPYAGAASKASRVATAARAAGATRQAATRSAMRSGAARGALLEGTVGAGIGGGFEALQQSRQIQQGLRQDYDGGQIAKSAAIEGALSGAIGAPLGALASRAPAERALNWQTGTPLGERLNSRLTELDQVENEARINAADDTLPDAERVDARELLIEVEKERADVQRAVNAAVRMDTELEGAARQIEAARQNGQDTTTLQSDYERRYGEFQDMISSSDFERVQRLSAQDIQAARAPSSPTQAAPTQAAPTQAATPAQASPTETAPTETAPTETAPTEAAPTQAVTPEAPAAPEAPVEPEAPAAPETPMVMEVPETKPVKFTMSEAQQRSFDKGWGANGATHANKATKAGNEPLTQGDLEKIVGSVENGVNKEGRITRNGMRAIREYMASREGRTFNQPVRRADEASFADPNIAVQKNATDEAVRAEAAAGEKAEVSDYADYIFEDILREVGPSNANRMLQRLSGLADEMQSDVVAAVRRRISDWRDNTIPVIQKATSDMEVGRLRAEFLSRQGAEDMKFTPNRVAGNTNKASKVLERDTVAGRVFREYTDPKTGEKRISSKVSRWLKRGMDVGDGRTVNEGASIFRRVNETSAAAEALALQDLSQGKLKAVYPFSARAGQSVIGLKGGRGRGGPAEDGQVVFGVMTSSAKSGRNTFRVYATEDMALKASGLKRPEDIKIDPSVHKPVTDPEQLEKLLDDAEVQFSRDGDFDKLDEATQLARAQARAGGLDVDPPVASRVVDGRGNEAVLAVPEAPITRGDKVLVLLPKTLEQRPRVVSFGYQNAQVERGATLADILGKGDIKNFNIGYVPREINGRKVTSATDRDAIKANFEPLNADNNIGQQPAKAATPETPAAPIDVRYEAGDILVDIQRLSASEGGQSVAQRLFIGARLAGSTNIPTKMEDFMSSQVSLADLYDTLNVLERQEFRLNLPGTETEVPFGRRVDVIKAYLEVLAKEAPLGFRRPTTDIESSLKDLHRVTGRLNKTSFGHIERMFRAIVPEKEAPIFKTIKEYNGLADTAGADAFYVSGRPSVEKVVPGQPFATDLNSIFVNSRGLDRDGTKSGISTSFVVMHELGHWAYDNLLPYDLKLEFWRSVSKYYDETGRFDGGFVSDRVQGTMLDARSPMVELEGKVAGVVNAKVSPQELWANQFSLWAHHKYNATGMMAPSGTDGGFFDKAAAIIKKLWMHITNRHIVDPELETIFDKMISRRDEARRVQFTFPKEPNTRLGQSLRIRYDQVSRSLRDFEAAIEGFPDMHDPEKMSLAARQLADAFNGMSMSQRERGMAARRGGALNSGEAERIENYSGVFKAITGHRTLRKYAKDIYEAIGATSETVSQVGDDFELGGSSFNSEMPKALVDIYNGGLSKYAYGKLEEMNEAYLRVEYGDIPEVRLSDDVISLRADRNLSGEILEKKQTFEQSAKRATNLQRRNMKAAFNQVMKSQAKANFKEFGGTVVTGTKGNDVNTYSMTEALAEYRRQIDADGNPSDFGKKLARRVYTVVNTDVNVPPLTPEEQAIYNTWQSKTRAAGGGNKGRANAVQKHEVVLGMAVSADGEAIKGLGATPEQAYNIIRNLIKQRNEARGSKRASRDSDVVDKAVTVEQYQDLGTSFENGIPANATFKMREYLRGITHRSPDIEYASRTITARLARLGVQSLPSAVTSSSYPAYRKIVRGAAANVSRGEDISQAVKFVGEALYSSFAISHLSRNVMSKAATILGDTPENLFSDIVSEVSDVTSGKQRLKVVKEIMDGEDADAFADFMDEIENEVFEAVSYTLNGLVAKKPARERFYAVTALGDMVGSGRLSSGSPRTRYGEVVPAEFAVDHANEILNDFSKAGLAAVREFTGGDVTPQFTSGVSDGPLGSGTYVRAMPSNTAAAKRDEILSTLGEEARGQAADLLDTLTTVRAKINMARITGGSDDYIDRLYAMDDVVSEQLEALGANLDTNVRPVFVRDTAPASFSSSLTVRDPLIKAIITHLKSSDGSMNQARALEAVRGRFDGVQMIRQISDIVGGERKFRRMMRDAGFTSISVGDEKLILNSKHVRSVRSDAFESATPIIGENNTIQGVNGRILRSISDNVDPIRVYSAAAADLEEAGVPAKTLEAMISVARGRGMPSEAAQEIRKSNILVPWRTNSKIMERSGIKYLANFFEPTDGSGGHFERTNARMGKFLMPFTKMLKELPDSGNVLTRYWRAGPQMMGETAMGALGVAPNRRQSQPASHMRIIGALRDSRKLGSLTASERKVYDHTRSYLDEATGRLRAAGAIVGEIKENYFPQIWRKDLIEMDQEEFTRRLTKYFLAERNGTGNADVARKSAERVVRRLLDEDGVFSNPAQNFKRSGDGAGSSSDHLDYQRLIRLEEFPEFNDFESSDSLAPFLENDLLVTMTKYSDNLEHRLDMTEKFGAGAHGYHDYMAIISQPMNAREVVGKLLSSNKIITTGWVRSGKAEHGVKEQVFSNNYFYAPIKQEYAAAQKADELIAMARSGATAAEIEGNIMELLGDQLASNKDAAILRQNFRRRAAAIANALSDTNGMAKVPSNSNLRHAQGFMNAAARKPIDGIHGTYPMRNASKWLRGVNAVTLLGFTTLTSLGDVVLPLIRTGDFASYTRALRKFAVDPEYRDMIRNVGAATENAVHQRLSVAHGVDSTQFMTGFFNSTLLTPWTDMMRDVAASVSYEHLKAQHKILKNRPNTRAGRIARRILTEEGLAEFANDKSLDMDLVMATRGSGSEHPLVDKLSSSAIKLTNQMIFTPNPNDIPLWAQTPLGALAFQLKSYPLMMTRLVNQVAGEAFRGETVADRGANFLKAFAGQSDNRLGPLAALLVAGPAMGSVAIGVKDIVQGRGGEDNREFELRERRLSDTLTEAFKENEDVDMLLGWYFDGMVALGGLGLFGELAYDIASQTDNGAYGTQRTSEALLGPTVGLYHDAMTVAQGARSWWDDDPANGERRAAVREIAGRVPVLGGVRWAREGVTDLVAGPRGGGSTRGGSGGGFGSGFGSSFGSGF